MGLVISKRGADVPHTIAAMEEAIVGAHDLWRRTPGGVGPMVRRIAGDAPWELMTAEAGDFGGAGVDGASDARMPRAPLGVREVDLRDTVTERVCALPDAFDRRLVWEATACLARGDSGPGGRLPWTGLARWLRWQRTPTALANRYKRVLAAMVCAAQGWPARRARVLVAAGRRTVVG